jgi:hypothetical protein
MSNGRMKQRKTAQFGLSALIAGALVTASLIPADAAKGGGESSSGVVSMKAYDASGKLLTWSQFLSAETNGHSGRSDDALLDQATLAVTSISPLYSSGGAVALAAPKSAALLSFAWPSSDGYSAVLLPVPSAGSYNFNLLLAQNAVATLHAQLAARPGYTPSADIASARASADSALATAQGAATDSATAVAASTAYEAAVHATLLLSAEYRVPSSTPTRHAVTLDEIPSSSLLSRVAAVTGPGGWIRLVMDPGTPFSGYASTVAAAHKLGLKVLGLPVDSSGMNGLTSAAWQSRWSSALKTLPAVDEWEAGNEVNGDWLGPNVASEVSWAAAYVRAHSTARVMVTLYWQLGEDQASDSMFNWVAAHPEVTAAADDVGISLYPENNPMGTALDAVLTRLHADVPGATLMISELGYWNSDLDHTWWWGSKSDPTVAGKAAVARFYSAAMRGYSYSGGGPFWWYYAEESSTSSPVSAALQAGWNN